MRSARLSEHDGCADELGCIYDAAVGEPISLALR
jgi:hypothetical protein